MVQKHTFCSNKCHLKWNLRQQNVTRKREFDRVKAADSTSVTVGVTVFPNRGTGDPRAPVRGFLVISRKTETGTFFMNVSLSRIQHKVRMFVTIWTLRFTSAASVTTMGAVL